MKSLELVWYMIVGLVQGISEPFPVSSSAQTLIATRLTKLNINSTALATQKGETAFDLMLNLGSAIAITLILLPTIKRLIKGVQGYLQGSKNEMNVESFKTTLNILIATFITGILGIILKSKIESFVSSRYSIIVMGIILFVIMIPIVLTINYLTGDKKLKDMTILDAILVGIFQTLALVPGLSRSGLTLLALKSRKYTIISAIKFSFLVYLPISLITIMKSLLESGLAIFQVQFILGAIFAFIGTYFTFNIMVSMARRKTLKYVTSWLAMSSALAIISFII